MGRRLLLNGNVNRLLGFLQLYGCPHARHHQPLMPIFFRLSPWLVDAHRRKILGWEQLTILVDVSERDGSSSFCFSFHMPEDIPVLPHDVVGVDMSRHHIFQHLVPNSAHNLLCPLQHVFIFQCIISAHFRHAFESIEMDVRDPIVHHNRPVVSIAERFLYVPPETTKVSFLIFKCPFSSFVASTCFRHIVCSIKQSPNDWISNTPIWRFKVCSISCFELICLRR